MPREIRKSPYVASLSVAILQAMSMFVLFVLLSCRAPQDEVSKNVARLIKEFQSRDVARRNEAEMELLLIGSPTLPALELANRSEDLEVAARALNMYRAGTGGALRWGRCGGGAEGSRAVSM